jgi:hypothetical protein
MRVWYTRKREPVSQHVWDKEPVGPRPSWMTRPLPLATLVGLT